jgi:hypothetical protein
MKKEIQAASTCVENRIALIENKVPALPNLPVNVNRTNSNSGTARATERIYVFQGSACELGFVSHTRMTHLVHLSVIVYLLFGVGTALFSVDPVSHLFLDEFGRMFTLHLRSHDEVCVSFTA